MATNYPAGLDNFTNPTATDTLGSSTVPHAAQHANINDAVEAIEAELGTEPKGPSASVAARLTTIESNVSGATGSIASIISSLGTGPTGSALALDIAQISAATADVLVAGGSAGQVDDTTILTWFKFKIDGVDYGVPGYKIN